MAMNFFDEVNNSFSRGISDFLPGINHVKSAATRDKEIDNTKGIHEPNQTR